MNVDTLHVFQPPRFISPQLKNRLYNPEGDVDSVTYRTRFIPTSVANDDLKTAPVTLPKTSSGSLNYNKAAALVDLVDQARGHNLGDGEKGIVSSQIIEPIEGHYLSIKYLEVDHFHPKNGKDGFITRLDALDRKLQDLTADAKNFVRNLKKAYPIKKGYWQWKHFLFDTEKKKGTSHLYKVRDAYRILAYNFIDNLWLIDGSDNGSFGDRHKIPQTGEKWKSSPLADKPFYGQDFLKLFGTVDGKGLFTRTKICSTGVIDMAKFSLDISTGKPNGNKPTGLGKIARLWFVYRYSRVSQPKRDLSLHVDKINQIARLLLDDSISKKEKVELKKQIQKLFLDGVGLVDKL